MVCVFIRNVVEKVFVKILLLVNCEVVVIWLIFSFSVDIFFWSVKWFVDVLILFCVWIVRIWICCSVVVIFCMVFLVIWVREILLLVLWIVWLRFMIWDVIWFDICNLVVLFLVLLIWKLEDKCLKVVFKCKFEVNSCCWVFSDDIFVLIYKFIF